MFDRSSTSTAAPASSTCEPINDSLSENSSRAGADHISDTPRHCSRRVLPDDLIIASLSQDFTITDLDYEVFKLNLCQFSSSNEIALPNTAQCIVPSKVAERPVDGIVWAATGTTGCVKGVMKTAPRYIKMDGSHTFQEMWVVDLDRETSEWVPCTLALACLQSY